jgi:hypothetical protein
VSLNSLRCPARGKEGVRTFLAAKEGTGSDLTEAGETTNSKVQQP